MKASYFTEAGPRYGLGHLKRCEAITQLLPELCIEPVLHETSQSSHREYNTWSLSDRRAYQKIMHDSDVVFVDTFVADHQFFEDSNKTDKVIYIDDYLHLDLPHGLVIDWTIGAEKYRKPVAEKSAFGIQYLVTRSVFRDRVRRKNSSQIQNILTVFGGADPRNLTPMFYEYLNGHYDVRCLATSHYPCSKEYADHPDFRFDLSDEEFVLELLGADLVISAGGQMLYELAVLGLPTLALSTTTNQDLDVNGFRDAGLVSVMYPKELDKKTALDRIDSLGEQERERMSRAMIEKAGDGSQFRECVGSYLCL